MNNRLLLLDFYHEFLKAQGVFQASFCYLDRKYKKNLSKFYYNEEHINVFHVKTPRVFNKSYEYKQNIDSILDFVIDSRLDITLEYENIDNIVKDVYYLKPLKNIEFKFLHIKYIDFDESYTGVLFAYSNNNELNIANKALNKIFKGVIEAEELTLENELNRFIVESSNNYIIQDDNKVYISDSIKSFLKLSNNYYNVQNKKYSVILQQLNNYQKTSNVINENKLFGSKITFFENVSENNNNHHLYSLNDLNINVLNDHFALIYLESISVNGIDYLNDLKLIKEELFKNSINNYNLYDINEGVIIVINGLIELSILEKIKVSLLKQINEVKCIYLNTSYHLNKNVDIRLLVKYLKENEEYSKEAFKKYSIKRFESSFLSNNNIIEKNIFNSYDNTLIGKYLGYNHLDLNINQKKNYFLSSTEEILTIATNIKNSDTIYLRITYEAFNSKKIWYHLNKIKVDNKVIILSEVEVNSKTELDRLIQVIHHLHELNYQIYFDSSVYSKIMLSDLINLYEGIYVEEYEMSLGYLEGENLFQNIIVFYLKQDKKILLNQSNIEDFEHPNVYYIK